MIAERITDSLLKEGIITDEERQIVRFGLESLGGDLLGVVMALTIGFCYKRVLEAVFLWFFLFPLRKNAGGYHATTKRKCFMMSALILNISFICFGIHDYAVEIYILLAVISMIIICCLAPMDNLSKKLEVIEQKIYRIRSRVVMVIELTIFVIAIWFEYEVLVRSISMVLFIVSFSLIMGYIRRTRNT